jgi:uncharacterized protein YehS (DUF1456 family)
LDALNLKAMDTGLDIQLLLNSAPAVNNVAIVAIDNGHELAATALGNVCELSYAVMGYDQLYNEVTVTMTHPATRGSDELVPNVTTRFVMNRNYNLEKYTATFRLTAAALEEIHKAAQQLRQSQPGNLLSKDGALLDHKMDTERRDIAKMILRHLQVAISYEINSTQRSLTLALSQAARSALRRMSVYLPLYGAAKNFKTSWGELNVSHNDTRPWLRGDTSRRTVF